MLTIASLQPKQLEILNELHQIFPSVSKEELLGYLKFRNFDLRKAEFQIKNTLHWRKTVPAPSILDIVPFLRVSPGAEGPDGAMVLLEDGKGNCARDKLGRPIIVMFGMLYGSHIEMQNQLIYCSNRVAKYCQDGCMMNSTFIILEVKARKGAHDTFRFPDKKTRIMMEIQKEHFPGSLTSSTHFCGVPQAFTWAFSLTKPFMDEEAYNNMNLSPNFNHLSKFISNENLLKEYGGELEFSIEKYIRWRAEEEGVLDLIDSIPLKRYADYIKDSSADDDSQKPLVMSSLQISQLEHKPRKIGSILKKGSGFGVFSRKTWKKKLLFVGPGGYISYFDSLEISEDNKVVKSINVASGFIEALEDEDNNHTSESNLPEKKEAKNTIVGMFSTIFNSSSKSNVSKNTVFSFQLVTAARSYEFSCESREERNEWIKAINEEIQSTVKQDLTISELDEK